MNEKEWKQLFIKAPYLWIPRNLILSGNRDEVVPQYFEKVTIVAVDINKVYQLENGKSFKPDILYILDSGEMIALEVAAKKKRGEMFKWAYQEVGIEAYEVQSKAIVGDVIHGSFDYLYSKKEKKLVEGYWDQQVNESFLEADEFVQRLYKNVARWEGAYYSFPETTPRYDYTLNRQGESHTFRTTFRTYQKVAKSYGHLFIIMRSSDLKNRIEKEELKADPIRSKWAMRQYCIEYETRLHRGKGVKI